MRGVFGETHPKNYPICILLTLPIKDFISDKSAALEAKHLIAGTMRRLNISKQTDHTILACNTAHLFQEDLEAETGIRFDSLLENTRAELTHRNSRKVGVLASPTSIKLGLHSLKDSELIHPSRSHELTKLIRDVVNGIRSTEQIKFLNEEIQKMFSDGAEVIVLGCTELEMLLADNRNDQFIRPLEVTVTRLLERNQRDV